MWNRNICTKAHSERIASPIDIFSKQYANLSQMYTFPFRFCEEMRISPAVFVCILCAYLYVCILWSVRKTCKCRLAYILACTCTQVRTYIPTFLHPHTRARIQTRVEAASCYQHTQIYIHMHTLTYLHAHTCFQLHAVAGTGPSESIKAICKSDHTRSKPYVYFLTYICGLCDTCGLRAWEEKQEHRLPLTHIMFSECVEHD